MLIQTNCLSLLPLFVGPINYEINVYDEYVYIGNIAVFKCHFPNYARDYLTVISWTQNNGRVIENINYPMQGN